MITDEELARIESFLKTRPAGVWLMQTAWDLLAEVRRLRVELAEAERHGIVLAEHIRNGG